MLITFESRRPEPLRPVPAARNEEQRAIVLQAQSRWQEAAERWRAACRAWSEAGDRARAEWALAQAGRCELQTDPEYQRLKAAGQVRTVVLGGDPRCSSS